MSSLNRKNMARYTAPLNMNGLQGRMLRLPATADKKREILLVYGHHSSLERWWGLIQELNQYGGVTVPDLPGFGGMHSMYKLKEKPSLDALADYLAAFVKLRYKRRRVTIVGVGFGFVVATRLVQRYPAIAKRVDLVVSIGGLAHQDDLRLSFFRRRLYYVGTQVLTWRLPAWLFRQVCLRPFVLQQVHAHSKPDVTALNQRKAGHHPHHPGVGLWRQSDIRTHMATLGVILGLDNCRARIDLPVWHVSMPADHYINNHLVEQHFKVIFRDYRHAPSKISVYDLETTNRSTAAGMLPYQLRRRLARS